jgi:hypothetical protein
MNFQSIYKIIPHHVHHFRLTSNAHSQFISRREFQLVVEQYRLESAERRSNMKNNMLVLRANQQRLINAHAEDQRQMRRVIGELTAVRGLLSLRE